MTKAMPKLIKNFFPGKIKKGLLYPSSLDRLSILFKIEVQANYLLIKSLLSPFDITFMIN